ncbi:MAG: VOC family protein [Actinomycetota bacterium]|jgi:catechol 2,3-dioxygenase-like lactoylglutathione lyase family enzyme|nr:VOC family protein [Actinomycetota bacterium]
MKVTRFHHMSVNVHDAPLEDVARFYRDVFGLADLPRPEIPGVPGHWHGVGDQELHLVAAPPAGSGIDPTGTHFCVAVDDLDRAVSELEERQIPYLRAVQGAGTVQIWVVDPAGNTIELQQDPESR